MPPILVIADDLSGAAELAQIAAARGLTATVHRHTGCSVEAEVIAIDTDSRASTAATAARQMEVIAEQARRCGAVRIFKKVDSLLRGQPRAEIEALIPALRCERTLLIPANPSRGRTISGGQYFVNGIPVNKTGFADDPEFPRTSSDISSLIGTGMLPFHRVRARAKLPSAGIIVPDIEFADDIRYWAETIDSSVLAAGAADFFAAMLDRWCGHFATKDVPASPSIELPGLLVCGSHAAWQSRKDDCECAKLSVLEVGTVHAGGRLDIDNFVTASHAWRSHRALVLSSGQALISLDERGVRLQALARMAALVIRQAKPRTLLLEGGATAAAVVSQLGWNRFAAQPSTTPGVGILTPIGDEAAPLVLIKPGSYPWAREIWASFCG